MCILNLRLGFLSRFILTMRSLRSFEVRVILSASGRLSFSVAGFGVFSMPQKMAACSIILCIYLDTGEALLDVLGDLLIALSLATSRLPKR
jgi:hypothetical protein